MTFWHAVRLASGMMQPRPLVLVAEDDHEMRRLVADAIRRDGYDVEELADGGRLLVRVARDGAGIALVVTDVRMPVCSGLDVVRGLREANRTVPVIVMTAFGDDEMRERAAALGALLFDKPFAMDSLRAAVRSIVPAP